MSSNRSILVIEAGRTERHYWRDLWRYRELFYFLVWHLRKVLDVSKIQGLGWLAKASITDDVFRAYEDYVLGIAE